MKKLFIILLCSFMSWVGFAQQLSEMNRLRAPAYPLITIDPYMSAWSFTDHLYGDVVRHWTGQRRSLIGAIRVDGKVFRFMGKEELPIDSASMSKEKVPYHPLFAQTAQQTSVHVLPTQTVYMFNCGGKVQLKLTFTAPLLPSNLDLLSRPVNYISYQVKSMDQKTHQVQVYFEATPEWAVNNDDQKICSGMESKNGMTFLKTGTLSQNILGTKGDNVRMDWGYFYLVGKQDKSNSFEINNYAQIKQQFIAKGELTNKANAHLSSDMEDEMTALGYAEQLGSVGEHPVSGYLMIGYDDIYSIQYFGQNLRAWWTKDGKVTIADAFSKAVKEYSEVMQQCATFNHQLMQTAKEAGGEKYADLCALAFRQSIAAHKLVKDTKGETLFFSKENFSNGSIGTVDVTYPSAPLFLYYNPELLKGMMNPIFYYCESGKWTKSFAPHDMGTYPIANGQTYGDGMPIEESGNMLLLTAAIAQVEGNADYAKKHWKMLSTWANYLLKNGFDPENQLCTDDFAGHFAHNANLSIKAILGIAAYGKLAGMMGERDIETAYIDSARTMAQKWVEKDQDGDHFRLTFNQPGTWSQKYNLVWDKLLNLNVFPSEVAQKEIVYYLTKQNKYGLPLDSRKTYTKSDWIMWTATLAPDKTTFEKLIAPVYRAFDETTSRVPMTDWYETTNARQVGFQARSVVGGYFMKMLATKLHHQ